MYGPYLTIAEIKAQYPNQWVLIGNPKLTKYHDVLGGVVIFCCANREEFHKRFRAWPDDPTIQHTASYFTGNPGRRFGDVIPDSEVSESEAPPR